MSGDGEITLSPEAVSERFRRCIPRDFARAHLIISQGARNGLERLAVGPGTDAAAIFNTGVAMDVRIESVVAAPEQIASLIDAVYGRAGDPGTHEDTAGATDLDRLLADADRDLLTTQGKGKVVRLVDALLFEALSRGASDVHVQPLEATTLIRYRLDGVLHTAREIPRATTLAVISRIKVMGRMDIAERRVPQDGRATVTIGDSASGGRSVDLRISTLPTSHGERAVVRLLDNTQHLCDFERLGMPDDTAGAFLARARRSSGIILVTGPTGSGKTTTLYSTLRRIGSPQINIMTIEDPIEYELASLGLAISQAQVNNRKGVTFASGLRHILRQDPDVVMVGEIRDEETARIAIQSSLTGHLVFATLHTNDAASAVTRLLDLGVEPYLVSASLSAVLAQRLVRLLHASCGGAGCEDCMHTGYAGRTGLFELLTIDEAIAELIARGAPLAQIREAGRSGGARSLRDEGARLVERGATTAEEVRRVVEGAL